ncbi:hypothetical protein GGD61_007015 [Bradyrhizobium sp. SBR1B]|nr:hypothetical protein [Bradyrhizobium sp. SBR1B]
MLSVGPDWFKDLAMNSLSPRAAVGLFLIVVLAWGVN